MGKIIAVCNEKGGVAKTTTVKNLAVGIGMLGFKVLAIDLDPSMNLTTSLGLREIAEEKSISDIYSLVLNNEEVPEGFGIHHYDEGIDVICCSKSMRRTESDLNAASMKEVRLRNYLVTIKNQYDYIFIDCAAGIGLFAENAMYAADELLIPVEPHCLSIDAIQNLFRKVGEIRNLNGSIATGEPRPGILGCVFTKARTITNNDNFVMDGIRELYGSQVRTFNTVIPLSSKFPESDTAESSIFYHAPHSTAARVYSDLIYELMEIEGKEF